MIAGGLSPGQIRTAYNLPSTGGSGTIAIIDAYDDPTALSDLNAFSSHFGLPIANFEKHMMATGIPTDAGWALEISLDVQWVHAIAPSAKILLVEATSSAISSLVAAVDYARSRSDVVAVSMSWGGSEFSGESSYDTHFTSSYGATFFAASGDSGAGVWWPAVSAKVVGVGGTTLTFAAGGGVSSETAWSGSGGGASAYVAEPSYQTTYGVSGTNGKRAVPDVSYDANPSSGVSVYDSTPYSGSSGWWVVGGTSAGTPQWAAIQSLGLSSSNSAFYTDAKSASHSSYFRDITSGSNGYPAKVGYDLVTGLGSPLTTNFAAPSGAFDFTLGNSGGITATQGASGSNTITAMLAGGSTQSVSLSCTSGLPAGASCSFAPASGSPTFSSVLTVSTSPSTPTGSNTVTVTGTAGGVARTTSFTLTVNPPSTPGLSVSVSTGSGGYHRSSTVSITVSVKSSGLAVSGASVTLKILNPSSGTAFTAIGTTSSGGTAVFTWRVPSNAQTGTYAAQATATATGYTAGSGSATFRVR